jgi:hypothetical protein
MCNKLYLGIQPLILLFSIVNFCSITTLEQIVHGQGSNVKAKRRLRKNDLLKQDLTGITCQVYSLVKGTPPVPCAAKF